MTFEADFQELRERVQEITDLTSVGAVLGWDRSTYLPAGGAPARARQSALLARLRHQKATDPALGTLLSRLERERTHLDPDGLEARLIEVARHDFDRATRVPDAFVVQLSQHANETYGAWTRARPENDFAGLVPRLERTLELSRQYATFFPEFDHPMDIFVDNATEGVTVAQVKDVFSRLRAGLVPLVQAVSERPEPRTDFLHRFYPAGEQLAFGESVIRDYGYDFSRGRQDLTHHPFCTRFSIDDVRITTRVKENDLTECLFSTLHESGHAMYEQGVDSAFEGTPLARGTSSAVHESQSRLWENVVGRGRHFWQHYFPRLQAAFPEQLHDVSADEMYRAVNVVRRSLIRTDADELTYNLHVILRFELELAMHEGRLEVRDLADAWHARYESDLGVRAPDDRDGVLQDVHWYFGMIGGVFHGYTLGNVLSLQFWDAARRAVPDVSDQIARGEFAPLRGWLTEHIYRFGRSRSANEIALATTGSALTVEPYLNYLRGKYGELYGVHAETA
ncbi:carboxypeptidase M32 [Deinococcus peraridilitoris]|uniref:Metal-dependent carboxypeptidase n=1 Tax=Deinococcus peraridilitoris (strain DSM 19664 / LMG 22246 / CIP 109416 / KR-200) TaxID=937777 RepID=L0A1X2_DEIPD|nr:carboxypeptidase M32 [Deinococcus peraridilitoris]AFZ67152.1 Zn-dependent carboxypeptidase [Deinococcus peraridilitoris DSM 19664]